MEMSKEIMHTLKKLVFSAMHFKIPDVSGGRITTETRPWLGLIGWPESGLATRSAVTIAADCVSPTRSITSEIATAWILKSAAEQHASIRVWSHNAGWTLSPVGQALAQNKYAT